jgi:alpha-ketoglutarate-dependent taurine dioxygenase
MIFDGYKVAGKPIDNIGQAALDKIWEIMDEPEMHCEFVLEPGQLQYVGNWRVAHRRTAYEDWPDEAQRRHLVRIFLRDSGRRSYNG